MKSTLRCGLFALAFACASSMASTAMTVSDVQPGKTVIGSTLAAKDLKNKVVLVLYWGTH